MTRPQPPLNYQSPPQARHPNVMLQAMMGCVAAASLVCIGAFGGIAVAHPGGLPNNTLLDILAIFGIPFTPIAIIIWIAVRDRDKPDRRAVVIGLWIGLGLGLLTIGVCLSGLK